MGTKRQIKQVSIYMNKRVMKRMKGETCALCDPAVSTDDEEVEEEEQEDELAFAGDSGSEEAHSLSSSWVTSEVTSEGNSSPSPPYLPISP